MANEKAEFSGNNVNYYLVEVKDPKRLEPYTAECEDIIEALNMTFAEGNAFKAIWRSCAARTLGKRKVGEDPHGIYDADKVSYYAKRMVAMRNRLKNEQNPEIVEYVQFLSELSTLDGIAVKTLGQPDRIVPSK